MTMTPHLMRISLSIVSLLMDMAEQPPENKLKHRCFPQPPDTAVRVWRYMDLAKLVWTLVNRKLWLSRIDLLQDPHEGSTPRPLAL